jgi:hypothetical protein
MRLRKANGTWYGQNARIFAHFTAVAWFVVHNVLAPASFVPFGASGVFARLNYTLQADCFAYLTFTVRK